MIHHKSIILVLVGRNFVHPEHIHGLSANNAFTGSRSCQSLFFLPVEQYQEFKGFMFLFGLSFRSFIVHADCSTLCTFCSNVYVFVFIECAYNFSS